METALEASNRLPAQIIWKMLTTFLLLSWLWCCSRDCLPTGRANGNSCLKRLKDGRKNNLETSFKHCLTDFRGCVSHPTRCKKTSVENSVICLAVTGLAGRNNL